MTIALSVLLLLISSVCGNERQQNLNDSMEEKCSTKAKKCKDGLILPRWNPVDDVPMGEKVSRALVYLIIMIYLFLGVSIVADRFMAAIEVVTSKERELIVRRITGEQYTILVRVWNETVSNLSLMALGSSAPEILLSVIEIFGNNFEAGELGPSTIVGSAAFNLLVIIAICVYVIPSDQVRRVKHITVFWVTVAWSIFAYVWLLLILSVFSPNEVEVWEGVLTFLFFPLTVLTAWIADRRMFGLFGQRIWMPSRPLTSIGRTRGSSASKRSRVGTDMELTSTVPVDPEALEFERHRNDYIAIFRKLRTEHPEAPIHVIESLAEDLMIKQGPKSRAFYRIQATRKLMGAGDIMTKYKRKLHKSSVAEKHQCSDSASQFSGFINVYFEPGHYTCIENVGTVYLTVVCDRADMAESNIVQVDYRTIEGTAQKGSDFEHTEGTLSFGPKESRKNIGVVIVDNDLYEEDEQFSVELSNLRAIPADDSRVDAFLTEAPFKVRLACPWTATVLIVDNDHAGAFGFESEKFEVAESAGEIILNVIRTRGARGVVNVPFKTIDGTAKAGHDYKATEGVLLFKDEQSSYALSILF